MKPYLRRGGAAVFCAGVACWLLAAPQARAADEEATPPAASDALGAGLRVPYDRVPRVLIAQRGDDAKGKGETKSRADSLLADDNLEESTTSPTKYFGFYQFEGAYTYPKPGPLVQARQSTRARRAGRVQRKREVEGQRALRLRRDLQPQRVLSRPGARQPALRRAVPRDLPRLRHRRPGVPPRPTTDHLGRGGRPLRRGRGVGQGLSREHRDGLRPAAHPAVGRARRVLQERLPSRSDLDPGPDGTTRSASPARTSIRIRRRSRATAT